MPSLGSCPGWARAICPRLTCPAWTGTTCPADKGDMPGMAMGENAAASMSDMAIAAMAPVAWTPDYAVLMFFTWWIMMMAMMLPSAAPMILLFALVHRKQRDKGAPYVPTGIFAVGYLLVWGAFSLVAVSTQWGLERTGLLSSMMASTSVLLVLVRSPRAPIN